MITEFPTALLVLMGIIFVLCMILFFGTLFTINYIDDLRERRNNNVHIRHE